MGWFSCVHLPHRAQKPASIRQCVFQLSVPTAGELWAASSLPQRAWSWDDLERPAGSTAGR